MSSLGSPNPFFIAGKKAYEVERSLRFNSGDNPYLTRTPSSSSNKKTMTFSFWFKRAEDDGFRTIFRGIGNSSNRHGLDTVSGGQIRFWGNYNGSVAMTVQPSQVFRDFSAWYHFVVALDTTQATASNRVKMYVNGNQITDFATASYPSQNFEFGFNDQNADTEINGVKGYIAEFQEIDGLTLDPSYFGETNVITGQWNPKKYTGSYGTNGFYLNFSDNSGTTATTLGKDSSGNSNNFTPNNFSVSDAVKDSPTNNFCTLNAVDFTGGSLVEGNLKQDNSSSTNTSGTFGMQSGKWYWEIYFNNVSGGIFGIGIGEAKLGSAINDLNRHYGYATNGQIYTTINQGSTAANYGASLSAGDILGVKYDADARELHFLKNNVSQGSAISVASGFLYLAGFHANNSDITVNFGQDSTFAGATSSGGNTDGSGQGDFKYAVPSGYKALCSANLPDPTIKLPNKHFAAFTYTGTGSYGTDYTFTDSDVDFTPDWVWIKGRPVSQPHTLSDSVRGVAKQLNSADSAAETTNAHRVNSFIQSGFTSGTDGYTNWPARTFVAWNWNAGDTDGKTYTVTVVDDSGNKYRFDGFGTSAVTLDLAEGGTYIFNYPSAHPFRFSTTSDGTHGGGSEYTTGVTVLSSTSVQIVVAASAPQLHYFCTIHSGMGGAINTNITLGSSNFDGTIQATAKANATAGFSVTTYSGTDTGSSQTIGHGLGVAPKVWIFKNRSSTGNWVVYTTAIDGGSDYLILNSTNASASGVSPWDTAPTSSVITVGTNNSDTCNAGDNYVLYAFSEVAGYSKFGSYVGNGSTDGTFVYTGFRPAFLLAKATYGTNNWIIYDNKREGFNPTQKYIMSNSINAENAGSNNKIDFLSNGFKFRSTGAPHYGTNSAGYIYLAFAESPFKNARAR